MSPQTLLSIDFSYGLRDFCKPPAQGEVDGLLKELGYSVDVNETLNAGIFQAPMGNEPALQAMFEEVKAGM